MINYPRLATQVANDIRTTKQSSLRQELLLSTLLDVLLNPEDEAILAGARQVLKGMGRHWIEAQQRDGE